MCDFWIYRVNLGVLIRKGAIEPFRIFVGKFML